MRTFARILGTFLLIEGVWGLFSPVVFGVLTTNTLHAVIHIVLGITGIALAARAGARGYLLGVGGLLALVGVLFFVPGVSGLVVGLLAVVGVLYFVPGVTGLVISLLNVNFAVACFNIVVGLASIVMALSTPKDVVITT